ncbi:DUF4012 domain-containing protein [Nocardioides albidus]|uniref:DUF4012 domain-containing protein n=1 Tax=Nocardioides albidus TaxID=1517589 RepID=A0A5C4W9X7_9ACTN|nr:DUF4012 domain-containing protein [Nocardioides albidus]TNM44139.1 DUF4012 domain-containing protein [Nocardioides albidus]
MSDEWPVERLRRRRTRPRTPWQRFRRRLRRLAGDRRRGGLVVGGIVLLLGVWVCWVLWSTSQALGEVQTRAEVMRAALIRGDADGARRAMADYQDAAETAESRTGGVTWSALELLPVLGDDLDGIAVVSGVLADLGRDGLPPLADAAEEVSGEAFRPTDHVFPVEAVKGLAAPADRSEAAFAEARAALAEVDPGSFVGPVRNRFDQLEELVDGAQRTLGSTYRAAELLPRLIGADRPRHFLMVLQNNAEARSSGGLPGALTLISADRGRVEVVRQADAADLGASEEPVLPLTEEERAVFGEILGTHPVDATLTPDFARAADLLRARWEQRGGAPVDGVLFVDPVAVSYLLAGTGPVPVSGYPPVTADTVVAAVENQIYRLSEDRGAHSDYQQAVAKAVFDAFADGSGNSVGVLTGLVRGVQEGRVRLHLTDPEEQAEIAGTDIAGEFSTDAGHSPQVGVYLNDAGPTKMQYYLKYGAHAFARSCTGGRQVIAGEIELHADTPADVGQLPPAITGKDFPGVRVAPGHQLLVLYLTTPVGGTFEHLTYDGEPLGSSAVPFAGRELSRVAVSLAPQERHRVSFVLRTGEGQVGDIELSVSPGARPESSNATIRSACAVR